MAKELVGYKLFELERRVESLALLVGSGAAHSTLTGLAADDHPQYALADGSRGAFATAAQGALASTAVQPAALAAYLPLAGGTLTGPLIGTTASFSDAVSATSFSANALDVIQTLTLGVANSTSTRDNIVMLGDANRIYYGTATDKPSWKTSAQDLTDSGFDIAYSTTSADNPLGLTYTSAFKLVAGVGATIAGSLSLVSGLSLSGDRFTLNGADLGFRSNTTAINVDFENSAGTRLLRQVANATEFAYYNVASTKLMELNLSTGALVVGTDPGGSELFRVGGAGRFSNYVLAVSNTNSNFAGLRSINESAGNAAAAGVLVGTADSTGGLYAYGAAYAAVPSFAHRVALVADSEAADGLFLYAGIGTIDFYAGNGTTRTVRFGASETVLSNDLVTTGTFRLAQAVTAFGNGSLGTAGSDTTSGHAILQFGRSALAGTSTIQAVLTGTGVNPLGLNPSGGAVIIGADPGTNRNLRVGGATYLAATNNLDYALHVKGAAGAVTYGMIVEAGAGASNGYPILFVGPSGLATSHLRVDTGGNTILGVDPGGSELLRVGGAGRFGSTLRAANAISTADDFFTDGVGTGYYIGDRLTDGTWRIRINGTTLVFERREAGTYVQKGSFAA